MKDVREQEGFLERRNYQQQFLPEWKEPGILRKTANNASSFASFPTKAHIVTVGGLMPCKYLPQPVPHSAA